MTQVYFLELPSPSAQPPTKLFPILPSPKSTCSVDSLTGAPAGFLIVNVTVRGEAPAVGAAENPAETTGCSTVSGSEYGEGSDTGKRENPLKAIGFAITTHTPAPTITTATASNQIFAKPFFFFIYVYIINFLFFFLYYW